MLNRLKNSLTIKIGILAALLLVCICIISLSVFSVFMPKVIASTLNSDVLRVLDEQIAGQMETLTLEESLKLLEKLEREYDITISVSNDTQYWATVDGKYESFPLSSEEEESSVDESSADDAANNRESYVLDPDYLIYIPYRINFIDQEETFDLIIYGNSRIVSLTEQMLDEIIPWLLFTCSILCLAVFIIYSFYITRPIVRISNAAQKIAGLDFIHLPAHKRQDEIGRLSDSLNDLSDSLSTALSDLKSANELLNDDIEKERVKERRRMEFFAAVSHDLKTPVTVIKGQLEGMIDGVGAFRDRDTYLRRSYETACRLEEMIREILLVSKIESWVFKADKKVLNLYALIENTLAQHEELFLHKEMRIIKEVDKELFILADGNLIEKVLSNLLVNAAAYSPERAEIRIRAAVAGKEMACLSIENSGVHIKEEMLPRLFESFYRVEQSRSRESGGSGLGLYIVKLILDLHEAEYEMKNTERGVIFIIRFSLS